METPQNYVNVLQLKIKTLEIENQRLASTIELNNKEISEYKSIIQSIEQNINPNNIQIKENKSAIDLKFKWKVSDKRKELICELKNDSKTIKKISNHGHCNCTAIGDITLIKGKINKWKIKKNSSYNHIFFGIVPSNIDLDGVENYRFGYVTNLSGFNKYNLGKSTPFNNYYVTPDDIIEIIVDLEKGELSFAVNDKSLGIFCDKIDKNIDYVPFVELFYSSSEISLL